MGQLEELIKQHEGFRPYVYSDSLGYATIGYGRVIDKRVNKGITQEEANYLLANDIAYCRKELSQFVWYNALDDVRKDVFVELCFNLGLNKLMDFKQTIASTANKDYKGAAAHLLDSLWAKQVSRTRSENIAQRLATGSYE